MTTPTRRGRRSRPQESTAPLAEPAPAEAAAEEAPAQPEKSPLSGNLDAVLPDGTLIAWCWSSDEPTLRREVSIWIDDAEVARAHCDQPRPDLIDAGIGDGAHALRLSLPASLARPGHSAAVTLRDVATGRQIGTTLPMTWGKPEDKPPAALPPPVLRGNVDRVTRDGWVSGWCWHPDYPDEHVDLTVLVDDEVVGSVQALTFRADLKKAGIGDGTHGFSFALPWSAMAEKGLLTITVRESGTGIALGTPILIRAGLVAMAEERIRDLERQLRLLRSQIDELVRQNQARDEERSTRALFTTVANFFQALGDGDPEATMTGGLKAAVEDVTTRFAPLLLSIPETPLATICVDAGAPIETLYECLAALHRAGADGRADIVLLDDGSRGSFAALLPAVVHNLRYVRVPARGSSVTARNEVASSARGELVAYLAPQVRVSPGWLDGIVATFAREPDVAAVTSKVVRDDNLLHHTGILLGRDGTLRDPGRLAAAADPEHNVPRSIDGFGDIAFALRRDMMASVGGFGTFTNPTHAAFDLCMRLRSNGLRVLYQPLAVAHWSDEDPAGPSPIPDLSLQDEDSRRLHQQWANSAAPVPAAT